MGRGDADGVLLVIADVLLGAAVAAVAWRMLWWTDEQRARWQPLAERDPAGTQTAA